VPYRSGLKTGALIAFQTAAGSAAKPFSANRRKAEITSFLMRRSIAQILGVRLGSAPAERAIDGSPRRKPWETEVRYDEPPKGATEMPHSFTNLLVHVIFSTDHRRAVIDSELNARLCPYLGGIIRDQGSFPVQVNAVTDHAHLLAQVPATIAVADLVRLVKANSSKWIHESFPNKGSFAWQTGYAAFSVSQSNRGEVVEYIRNQESHHRKMTFKEELIAYLKKNNIPFDERYIWE